MSTSHVLLNNLGESALNTEVHLVGIIQDFAYSRTVGELVIHTQNMIASLTGGEHGITPRGFRMILRRGLSLGIDQAKS